jgi:hypothetical protein
MVTTSVHLALCSQGAVDAPGHIQLQSQTVEGGHRAGRDRRNSDRPRLRFLLASQDIFGPAQVSQDA